MPTTQELQIGPRRVCVRFPTIGTLDELHGVRGVCIRPQRYQFTIHNHLRAYAQSSVVLSARHDALVCAAARAVGLWIASLTEVRRLRRRWE